MSEHRIGSREHFLEKILFDIFMDCIVIKDSGIFDYRMLRNVKKTDGFPIQTVSLIEEYASTDGSRLDAIQANRNLVFIMYMNYKHLFQLEYFDDILQKWVLLDNSKLSSFTGKLLCRIVQYINEKLGIITSDDIPFSLVNQHFILSN